MNVAEAYLKFKMSHANYNETDDTGIVIEEDWVYLSDPPKQFEDEEDTTDDVSDMQEVNSSLSSSTSLSTPSSSPILLQ